MPQILPLAPFPLVLGVLRRLAGATVLARLMPPHPAPVRAGGRGVEAWGLALLEGQQALDKGGPGWPSGGW